MLKAEVAAHFWSKVDRSGGPEACWPWTASGTRRGYGLLRPKGPYPRQAHRRAWYLTVGPIPPGLLVCHRCDNPPCCNPAHLFLGTTLDNVRDMDAKGRRQRNFGEKNPASKLTAERVRAIRACLAQGHSARDTAVRFGISRRHVDQIKTGVRWAALDSALREPSLERGA
jgi:hypothetical protein